LRRSVRPKAAGLKNGRSLPSTSSSRRP
jgi:hypothetical protein